MPRKGHVGWFVEVPIELKQEFQSLYRGRAAMRRLTVAAIQWAIDTRPNLTPSKEEPTDDQTTMHRSDTEGH